MAAMRGEWEYCASRIVLNSVQCTGDSPEENKGNPPSWPIKGMITTRTGAALARG